MYYYKKKGKDIVKYEVNIDEEELKKLRLEIILNCSRITHHHYKTTKTPNCFDWEHIQNYRETKVGIVEYNDFYSMPEDEYLVDYDYYEHPLLVKYIEDLLKGDTSAIEQIKKVKDDTLDKEQKLLDEQQNIINKLNDVNNLDKSKQIRLLNENQEKLLEYYKEKELNKNQVPSSKYKNKVLNCITLKEVEVIPYKTVLEVIRFLACCSDKKMDSSLNKVLKLNL